ncbi:MAG: hypothetical protein KJO43_12055, partial [Phycisphaerae bacterium]|nr:hypothetical protein [Phycisphaerae bacterium]
LAGVWSTGTMAKSMTNMRQVALWMTEYSASNNDTVLPSRFNYGNNPYPGKVRSVIADPPDGDPQGEENSGTWTDILHATYEVAVYPGVDGEFGSDYRYDSPDKALYELLGEDQIKNPFRSAAPNTMVPPMEVATNDPPTPYGRGATGDYNELGLPGFFAANDFFNAGWDLAPGEWFNNGQIRYPDQSMYLVDSFYGETILPEPIAYDAASEPSTQQVDFRYTGEVCLMLYLDGHIGQTSRFETLDDLEAQGVRVRNLTSR